MYPHRRQTLTTPEALVIFPIRTPTSGRAIVGFELPITRLEGKWKMSQNRSAADIDGVVRGLSASPAPGDRAVAEIVQGIRPRAEG